MWGQHDPKSIILATPYFPINMLPGFKSLWINLFIVKVLIPLPTSSINVKIYLSLKRKMEVLNVSLGMAYTNFLTELYGCLIE